MQAVRSHQQERLAFEHVLESGLFEKSPRLGRFFRYICELHFDGRADQVKEYSIATEALGRGSDFDPKKDSIVRVEAHRLRKRLEEYYSGVGAAEEFRITIPNGQYRPVFIPREAQPLSVEAAASAADLPLTLEPAVPVHRRVPFRWIAVSGAIAFIAAVAWASLGWMAARDAASDSWSAASAGTLGPEVRILAGYHGPAYTDRQGHTWTADEFFQGGKSQKIATGTVIEAQPDPQLLRSARVGQFRYDIPLVEGPHELHLLFAETTDADASKRVFQLRINGGQPISPIDPVADAGARDRLSERVYRDVVAAKDGKLHLQFEALTGAPTLSAIEILPSVAGKIHPVRMVAQAEPVSDSEGRVWAADEYFCGGTEVMRGKALQNPLERGIYRGERFGNFSYRIPLAPGKYRLTLHFAEQWWGTPDSQMAPVDSREFDVFANREPLLRNFVVGTAAGGAGRSLEKVFDNVQPNAQGVLLLEFVPTKNYAEVNAIEVVSED